LVLVKNITRARPQLDVRPGRQRVFLTSPKEEIARVRLWSRLGVLLIKNISRARPPLDDRHPNGTHHIVSDLQHAPRAESKRHKSITLWHAMFFWSKHWQALEGRTTGMLFLKRARRQALAWVRTGDGCKIGMCDGYKTGMGNNMMNEHEHGSSRFPST
jgi:hypothetical protein